MNPRPNKQFKRVLHAYHYFNFKLCPIKPPPELEFPSLSFDLDYEKDSNAEVDLNLVLDEKFEILEIQGTAEGKPFPKEHLDQLFELGKECIKEVFEIQK